MENTQKIKWGRMYEGNIIDQKHMKYVIPTKEVVGTLNRMIWVYDLATAKEYKIYDFTLYYQYRLVE